MYLCTAIVWQMKWTVLLDNRTCNDQLQTEHGLSILLETDKHRILLDTGASDVFIRNAERLRVGDQGAGMKIGIDLSTVDYVFISHGHSDHAGGLKHFMEINTQAQVIVSPDALKGKYYSKSRYLHSITTEWPEISQERLLTVEHSESISDDIFILAHIPQIHPMPEGNQHLFVENADSDYVYDDFRHELALYTGGLLFTGCAHSGLENILAACPFPVNTVVGGFHLLDDHEAEEELTALAQRLKTHYPHTQFYTSHCTGDTTFSTLKAVMGEQLHAFSCGTTNFINMTDFEKMRSEEFYDFTSEECLESYFRAKHICAKLQTMTVEDDDYRKTIEDLIPGIPESSTVSPPFHCDHGHGIKLGENVFINYNGTMLDGGIITIGSNTQVGPNCQFLTPNHPIDYVERRKPIERCSPITIGEDCWLGGGVTVCPGVTIGDRCIIGAGSVVTKDIPEDCVAVGNPCRVIKKLI